MEEKINVAELLKDCPKGMELDCVMYEDVKFIGVEEYDKPICIKAGDIYRYLTKFGTWTFDENAKCVIFPKGKASWEGFQRPFKDGDVVFYSNTITIFKEWGDETLFRTYCVLYTTVSNPTYQFEISRPLFGKGIRKEARFATEKEKQKLFKAIKDNGYKWNAETKTLEKLIVPKFKVGDRIVCKNGITKPFTISKVGDNCYYVNDINAVGIISLAEQDNYELVPNKFDITTLIPFESRVLVRNSYSGFWMPTFWGVYETEKSNEHQYRNYLTTKGFFRHCIPYNDDTKHLVGKTDDCDEYYKTWE